MIRFAVLIFAALLATANVTPAWAEDRPSGVDIRVEGDGWAVPSETIQKTLFAGAGVLLPHVSRTPDAPIVVTHTNGPPVTLYERGPHGEYLVHLHASGARWHLYVYEFAHELTHILSNYQHNVVQDATRHNQWLEESLCETASLFVLDRLGASWQQASRDPEAVARGAALRGFFDALIDEPHRRLPAGYSFASWLADNESSLRRDPYLRRQDDLVARRLLPLFERDPDGWDAVRYLNLDAGDNDATLAQFLGHWHANAPASHKPFVESVLNALAGQNHETGSPGLERALSRHPCCRKG